MDSSLNARTARLVIQFDQLEKLSRLLPELQSAACAQFLIDSGFNPDGDTRMYRTIYGVLYEQEVGIWRI